MPDNVHLILFFDKEREYQGDPNFTRLYEYLKEYLIDTRKATEIALEGLSTQDISKWITYARNVTLPLVPDLIRIREQSAGIPLLLNELILHSTNLSADEIKKEGFCGRVIKRSRGLSDEDLVRLYKMSVLKQPLSELETSKLLDVTVDSLLPFFRKLSERGIFDGNHEWFQHELIQKCIEDDLSNEQKKRYHNNAADLFLGLLHQEMCSPLVNRNIAMAYAYHVYYAGRDHESYHYNKSLAEVTSKLGDLDLAEQCYRRAIDNARNLGNDIAHAVCLIDLSRNVLNIWGNYDESIKNYRWILNNFSSSNEVIKLILMIDLAHTLYFKHQYTEASDILQKCISKSRLLENKLGKIRALQILAAIDIDKGEYDLALPLFQQILSITEEINDKGGMVVALNEIANILFNREEFPQALLLCERATTISSEIGDQFLLLSSLFLKARILKEQNRTEESLNLLEHVLSQSEQMGYQIGVASVLYAKADLLFQEGNADEALAMCEKSISIYSHLSAKRDLAAVLKLKARIHHARGETSRSLEVLKECLLVYEQLGALVGVTYILILIAKLLKEMGDRKQALLYFDRASESYKGLHRQVEEFEQELDSIKQA